MTYAPCPQLADRGRRYLQGGVLAKRKAGSLASIKSLTLLFVSLPEEL